MPIVRVVAAALAALGCSKSPPQPGAPVQAGPVQTSSPASPRQRAAAAPSPGSAPSPAHVEAVAEFPFELERVDARHVVSLAFGKPPRVAILTAGEVSIFDRSGARSFAAPETAGGDWAVELFFGRDDQPRLMGSRRGETGSEAYYRRLKSGRFQPEPSELGPLAAGRGELYGVLGHADPEVVCKPNVFCLIKRVSGWTKARAHAEPVRVQLAGGHAFALHADRIERLEGDAWRSLEPQRAWQRPGSVFVDAGGIVWVVEAGGVLRLVQGAWEAVSTPVGEPLALGGSAEVGIWLAGRSGAARFDGTAWTEVPSLSGPLHLIGVSADEVWLAGRAGTFRASRRSR